MAGSWWVRNSAGRRPRRGKRDRVLFVAVLILVVALLTSGIVYISMTSRQANPVAVPSAGGPSLSPTAAVPSPSSPSPSASASPTPEMVDGFANCAQFGYNAVCPVVPECWGGLLGLTDVPVVATPIECSDSHPYQTFIAVQLPEAPRTQSELENAPAIKALCTKAVLNRRLASGQAGATWDIQPIPYKVFPSPDNLSRCLVGTGVERTRPVPMKAP